MKLALVLFFLIALPGSQSEITLNADKSSMKVFGTSSIHNWELAVNEFSVNGTMTENLIKDLEVKVDAESIKSGKSVMDDKTYEALKTGKYPTIIFKANQLTITGQKVTGKGTISLVGKTKPIEINAEILSKEANEMQLQGLVNLKMTDFGIDPPTAMFGSIRTGDEVTIKYDILLTNNIK